MDTLHDTDCKAQTNAKKLNKNSYLGIKITEVKSLTPIRPDLTIAQGERSTKSSFYDIETLRPESQAGERPMLGASEVKKVRINEGQMEIRYKYRPDDLGPPSVTRR